jgi:molecular chaperone DnaK (HSP70)
MLANHRKTAVEVVADYLRLLWKHVIKTIERERGSASASRLPFRVVLTVPAIWPHNAQQRMREAASKAGILAPRTCGETTLRLVPEPEAAALASLSEFRDREDVQECLSLRNNVLLTNPY